jgi:hypothetical protein
MQYKDTSVTYNPILSLIIITGKYILFPLLFIWSVNTLFGTIIPFTIKTWLASVILIIVIRFAVKGSILDVPPYYEDEDVDYEYDDKGEEIMYILPKSKKKRKKSPDWNKPP